MKKVLIIIFSLITILSCGPKTKTQTENQSQISAQEIAQQEKIKQAETKRLDSIRVILKEELIKEFNQKYNESSSEENTRKTTTEVTETLKNPLEGFRPVGNGDIYINDSNGQLLERKTKTIIEERFKKEQQKEIETKRIEQEKKIKDSIARNEYIDSTVEKVVEKHMSQYEKKDKGKVKVAEQKGFQLGFWGWFWIITIILIILAFTVFRKWLLIQFPILRFLIKS